MPVTGHGPACSTVTRWTRPSSPNRWVMPSLRARIPGMALGESDLDVHAGGEVVEALERVDRLRRGLVNVDEPLVGADLEVLLGVLVLERRADHRIDGLVRGQRNGTGHRRAGARGRFHDLLGRHLDRRVVIGLEPDPDLVLGYRCHGGVFRLGTSPRPTGGSSALLRIRWAPCCYSTISVTTPDPTVRPPSRIAKRRPWSMAIGWMSSTSMAMSSPGMTISTPSGRFATPVTSVVRK